MNEYPENFIKQVRNFLGKDGIEVFTEYKEKYGIVDPVIKMGIMPWPVHFREGMQVRNFLRTTEYCKDWDQERLDNEWSKVIERAISV